MWAYLTHDMALPTSTVKTSKIKRFMIHWMSERAAVVYRVFNLKKKLQLMIHNLLSTI